MDDALKRYHETLDRFAKEFVALGSSHSVNADETIKTKEYEDLKLHFEESKLHFEDLKQQYTDLHVQYETYKSEATTIQQQLIQKQQLITEQLHQAQNELLAGKFDAHLQQQSQVNQQLDEMRKIWDTQHAQSLTLQLQNAKEEEAQKYIEKVSDLSTKLAVMTESKQQLEQQINTLLHEQKELQKNQKETHILPSVQGAQGEAETRSRIQDAFQTFFVVEDVSKRGQGKEMDIKLTTHYDDIVIRIDCKNYLHSHQIPEKEITRFNEDMDSLAGQKEIRADVCILFTRHPVKGNSLSTKHKRGPLYRYHVGMWSFHALFEALLDSVVSVRMDRLLHEQKTSVVLTRPGTKELRLLTSEMIGCIQKQNTFITEIGKQVHNGVAHSTARSRIVNTLIQSAHNTSPDIVTNEVVKEFEKQLPKQARGRPISLTTIATKKRKTATEPKNSKKVKKEVN